MNRTGLFLCFALCHHTTRTWRTRLSQKYSYRKKFHSMILFKNSGAMLLPHSQSQVYIIQGAHENIKIHFYSSAFT
ncbi:hypothetical protein EDD85DRAFT_834497 [Armillaria nabsnona]|nr:hypothetical protein EDD85DRAFT_834497 [Armillaria nabsnona]